MDVATLGAGSQGAHRCRSHAVEGGSQTPETAAGIASLTPNPSIERAAAGSGDCAGRISMTSVDAASSALRASGAHRRAPASMPRRSSASWPTARRTGKELWGALGQTRSSPRGTSDHVARSMYVPVPVRAGSCPVRAVPGRACFGARPDLRADVLPSGATRAKLNELPWARLGVRFVKLDSNNPMISPGKWLDQYRPPIQYAPH